MAKKSRNAALPGSREAELISIGVEAAGLLRRVRELKSSTLNYFFEMAWHAVYQQADEQTLSLIHI